MNLDENFHRDIESERQMDKFKKNKCKCCGKKFQSPFINHTICKECLKPKKDK